MHIGISSCEIINEVISNIFVAPIIIGALYNFPPSPKEEEIGKVENAKEYRNCLK